MPTLNEKFEAWYCEAFETTPSRMRDDQKHYDCNRSGFLAGAKAEREESIGKVLEIVIDYLRNRLQTLIAPEHINEVERRIKERDNG